MCSVFGISNTVRTDTGISYRDTLLALLLLLAFPVDLQSRICIRLSASGCDLVPFLQFPAQSAMILRELWPDYFGLDFFLSGFPQFPVVFTAKIKNALGGIVSGRV